MRKAGPYRWQLSFHFFRKTILSVLTDNQPRFPELMNDCFGTSAPDCKTDGVFCKSRTTGVEAAYRTAGDRPKLNGERTMSWALVTSAQLSPSLPVQKRTWLLKTATLIEKSSIILRSSEIGPACEASYTGVEFDINDHHSLKHPTQFSHERTIHVCLGGLQKYVNEAPVAPGQGKPEIFAACSPQPAAVVIGDASINPPGHYQGMILTTSFSCHLHVLPR